MLGADVRSDWGPDSQQAAGLTCLMLAQQPDDARSCQAANCNSDMSRRGTILGLPQISVNM
jgi:hypothetical protein